MVSHYFSEHQGGVEIVAEQLARRLSDRQFAVIWAATGDTSQPADGIQRICLRAWNGIERRLGVPFPVLSIRGLVTLWKAVRNCDAVHLHESVYPGNVFAFLAAKLLRKRTVITQHVGEVPFRSRYLRAILWLANHTAARYLLSRADQVVFISEAVRQYFRGFVRFRREALLIPNGVDASLFNQISRDERATFRKQRGWGAEQFVMLFVGRFVEKKGLHLMRQLAERFPQCTWVFVGWGPENPETWGIPNVHCVGRLQQAELATWYPVVDLLVLPSVGEGFPLVVQEAMACGTTAVLTHSTVGGLPDVRPLVHPAKPEIDDLAAVIARLTEEPEQVRSCRNAVSEYARGNWCWEICADEYVTLLSDGGDRQD